MNRPVFVLVACPVAILLTALMCAQQAPMPTFEHVVLIEAAGVDRTFTNVADINGDGYADILGFNGGDEGYISWYEYPDYTHHIVKKAPFNPGRPLAADVDTDGDADLVVAKSDERHLYWYENPLPGGDPAADAWTEHHVGDTRETTKGDFIKDYGVADFDRDGRNDIVVCTFDDPADVFIYFQNSASDWTKVQHKYAEGHEGLDLGDLDNDGDLDIVTNGRWFEVPAAPRENPLIEHVIDEKWHNQEGTWQKNATMIRVADVNGDGRLDVLISHSEMEDYPLSWYEAEDPKGSWTEHHVDPSYGWCQTLDVGDVDLDGDLDVLAARFTRPSEPMVPPPHDVRIYYNGGDGLTWEMQVMPETEGTYFAHLVDMGNDGDLDVVGPRSYFTGPIEMWENLLNP